MVVSSLAVPLGTFYKSFRVVAVKGEVHHEKGKIRLSIHRIVVNIDPISRY